MIAVKIILRQSYSKHDTPTQIFFCPFNAKIDPKMWFWYFCTYLYTRWKILLFLMPHESFFLTLLEFLLNIDQSSRQKQKKRVSEWLECEQFYLLLWTSKSRWRSKNYNFRFFFCFFKVRNFTRGGSSSRVGSWRPCYHLASSWA